MKTLFICLTLASCSALDPSVGAWRIEQPATSDAAVDVPPGVCDGIGEGEVCFARDIRPLMDRPAAPMGVPPTPKGCRSCHYSTELKHNGIDLGGLDLATLGSLRRGGGSSGKRIVVPHKPAESVLVQALLGTYGSNRMPKGSNYWTDDEIALVARWISEGGRGRSSE